MQGFSYPITDFYVSNGDLIEAKLLIFDFQTVLNREKSPLTDLGFNLFMKDNRLILERNIKLYDVDCPSDNVAAQKIVSVIRKKLSSAKELFVVSIKKDDGFGNMLGAIYADDRNLGSFLLREGLAKRHKKEGTTWSKTELSLIIHKCDALLGV